MPRPRFVPPRVTAVEGEPFHSAEEAWFWAVRGTLCRLEGARMQPGLAAVARRCEPVDVLTMVERLYRDGRLDRGHVDVLARFGRMDRPPHGLGSEADVTRIWEEALDRLATVLATRGLLTAEVTERV